MNKRIKKAWKGVTTALSPTLSSFQTVRVGSDQRQHVYRWKKIFFVPILVERVTENFYRHADNVKRLTVQLEKEKTLALAAAKQVNVSLKQYGISSDGTVYVNQQNSKAFISADGAKLDFEFKHELYAIEAKPAKPKPVVEEWNTLQVVTRPPNQNNGKGNRNNGQH